jgi:hypothetical protein
MGAKLCAAEEERDISWRIDQLTKQPKRYHFVPSSWIVLMLFRVPFTVSAARMGNDCCVERFVLYRSVIFCALGGENFYRSATLNLSL